MQVCFGMNESRREAGGARVVWRAYDALGGVNRFAFALMSDAARVGEWRCHTRRRLAFDAHVVKNCHKRHRQMDYDLGVRDFGRAGLGCAVSLARSG